MANEGVSRYCMECGSAVEPGAEFCYICGSKHIVDVNQENNHVILEPGKCPFCGHQNETEDKFCRSCGERIGEFVYSPRRKQKLTQKGILAIFLALIPGAFNVFGLGHLVVKKISRGMMYLGFSAIILYLRYCSANMPNSTIIFIEVLGFVIYLKQAFEIFEEAYKQ